VIHHHRDAGKKHKTDLTLLEVAVREAPHDARAQWYLAREMDYAGHAGAADAFTKYLAMPGGQATERAYAERALWRLTGDEQHLHNAAREATNEPDAWERLAFANYQRKDWRNVAGFARQAIESPGPSTHCTDPHVPVKARDLLAVALWELGKRDEALRWAREAAAKSADDPRLAANVAAMERILSAGAAA
jgi:tetratricopeptide (TPR) repeat protein